MENRLISRNTNQIEGLSLNYTIKAKWTKFKRRINIILVDKIANTPLQFKLYSSYWHYRFFAKKDKKILTENRNQYLAQKPDYGAGIGHQLANWNSGLFFSKHFNLKFAYFPFSNSKWDSILGFGEAETSALGLIDKKIKVIKLPRFDSENLKEIDLIRDIILSYETDNILFLLEINQGYIRQYDTAEILKHKYFCASARKQDLQIASKKNFNIAIHIRRGDIIIRPKKKISNLLGIEDKIDWKSRVLDNQYYLNVLKQVLQLIKTTKKIEIYIFSQGSNEDFSEFKHFSNVHFCLEMSATDSFVEMVNADLLISSKSSFSYKPALISKGIKICPENFWHGYPETPDFILANDEGKFDPEMLLNIFSE